MKIKIELNESQNLWFLGEPKAVVVSLSYLNPGPVEVDFDSLVDLHKKQLLIGMRDNVITSPEISFQDLYQVYLKSRPTVQEVTPDPQEQIRLAIARQAAERVASRQHDIDKKQQKFEERCRYLSKQSVSALKTTIAHEDDGKTLHELLRIEEQEKQRTMVIRFLRKRLLQLEQKRAKEIEKATRKQINANPQSKKTSPLSVVESEQETVTLTPEDLIKAITATRR